MLLYSIVGYSDRLLYVYIVPLYEPSEVALINLKFTMMSSSKAPADANLSAPSLYLILEWALTFFNVM